MLPFPRPVLRSAVCCALLAACTGASEPDDPAAAEVTAGTLAADLAGNSATAPSGRFAARGMPPKGFADVEYAIGQPGNFPGVYGVYGVRLRGDSVDYLGISLLSTSAPGVYRASITLGRNLRDPNHSGRETFDDRTGEVRVTHLGDGRMRGTFTATARRPISFGGQSLRDTVRITNGAFDVPITTIPR